MILSPQTLTLGPVAYGRCVHAQHSQWGNITLDADGRVDDAFTHSSRPNSLRDDGMANFIACESRLANSSKQWAREAFEAGRQCERPKASEAHLRILNEALQESGLDGSVYPATDWRGVMTGCTVRLNGHAQTLHLEHGQEGARAVLSSRIEDGTHRVDCPVDENGALKLGECTEHLTLKVPWLCEQVTAGQGEGAITSMEDARMGRLTEAAQLGFLVTADELGPGWTGCQEAGTQCWVLERSSEQIVLDPKARSLTITASGWVSHGEHDSEIHDTVVYQDGKFRKSF